MPVKKSKPELDRVIAKIEAHKVAFKQYQEMCGFEDKFSSEIDRVPRVYYGSLPEGKRQGCPKYLYSAQQIREKVAQMYLIAGPRSPVRKQWNAYGKKWLAELAADAKALKRAQDKSGYTAARKAYDLADRAERRTFDALLRCRPTTPLGIMKLTNYLGTHWARETIGGVNRKDVLTTLHTIHSALDANWHQEAA